MFTNYVKVVGTLVEVGVTDSSFGFTDFIFRFNCFGNLFILYNEEFGEFLSVEDFFL